MEETEFRTGMVDGCKKIEVRGRRIEGVGEGIANGQTSIYECFSVAATKICTK